MNQLPDLHISFIANGDNSDPIQVINRIIEQMELDFKRDHLLEYDVSLTDGSSPPILLIHKVKENESKACENEQ